MSSIPLPAMGIKPVEQPDTLGNFQKLLAIKNAQTMAPLQQQEARQNIQSSGLQIQQQQQQLKDQQALTAAMQQWDGKDYNQLYPLVTKNGGSGQAVIGLKQKALEQQKTISEIAEKDATTGSKNIETMKQKNDMVAGALSTVMGLPDEGIAQGLTQTAQELGQKGLIDPAHAQAALQLAQSGDPAKIRQQLDIIRKGSMAQSQITEEALKKAQTREAGSRANEADINAQKTTQEMQLGTGPMAESKYRNILMNEKLNRPVSEEDQAWKSAYEKQKTLVPTTTVNLQSNLLSDQAKQMAADMYQKTGQLPAGMRSPGMAAGVLNKAASGGPVDVAGNKATYQANADSLRAMQKQFDNVTAFENTAGKNLDTFLKTAKDVVDSGSPLLNKPLRAFSDTMMGSPNMAAYKAARQTAITEIAKVLSSANAGSGVLSDSARHEVEGMIGPDANLKQIYAAANILKQDMKNRHDAYADQLGTIKQRMGSGGQQNSGEQNSAPDGNDPFSAFGGKKH